MDRDGEDEELEILDDGRGPSTGPGSAPLALPPLDLSEPDDGTPPTVGLAANRLGRGWAAPVALFVIGLLLGGYVWSVRSEAADLAAQAGQVVLVPGWFDAEFSLNREVNRMTVALYNAGGREVVVDSVRPGGWVAADEPARPEATTIPAAAWADVEITARPSCPGPVPDRLHAEVRTEQGESSVVMTLPHDDVPWHQSLLCREFDVLTFVMVSGVEDISLVGPGQLRMGLLLFASSPLPGSVEITAVGGSGVGFRGVSTGLPVSAVDGTDTTVLLDWHIDNCAATRDLGELAIDVELNQNSRATVAAPLPDRAIAALARFAGVECGP